MNKTTGFALFACLLIVASGLLLAWRVMIWQETEQRQSAQERFHNLAQRSSEQLLQRMTIYQYGLRGMRGALISLGEREIRRDRVINYSQSRDQKWEFPGSRGFGFIRRVPRANEAAFLKRASQERKTEFTIRQIAPHNDERLIIEYIEPEASNREALGLDIASEANRRDAAWQAIRSGQATLTHPITLVQAAGMINKGFLLLLPTYQTGATPVSLAAREQSAFGLAYTPLTITEILSDFDFRNGEFSMAIYDLSDDGQSELFYNSAEELAPAANGLSERIPLPVFGRQWLVEIKAQPIFIQNLNHTPPRQTGIEIALGGLALAGLVYGFLVNEFRKAEVFKEKSRLAAIVEDASDAIIGMTLAGRITDWNPAAETIFGYSATTAIGRMSAELIVPDRLHSDDNELLTRVAAGEIFHNLPTHRKHSDGSERDVSLTLSPIRNDKDQVIGIAQIVRDISVEVAHQHNMQELNWELERKVKERTTHLDAAVQELVDFSYLASHDLRTPLRALDGFSSLLLQEQTFATASATEYLQRIRSAAQQMGHIIDDMVKLLGVVRSELEPQAVDLSAIAHQEIERISRKDSQRQIDIQVQPGLQAYTDPKLTRMLMNQLIDNAWKFTREVVDAKIEITGCETHNSLMVCSVSDNGIGFDLAYAKRIFTPFQRLPQTQQYPGTGIGLALVQRIVRKLGGVINVDAAPGKGATFTFSLPATYQPEILWP